MLISRNWLQSYFEAELPSAEKIADTLMMHSFEIEDVFVHENGDGIIDIDVLPNRAHDCLGYRGVAKELSGLLGLELKADRFSDFSALQNLDEKIPVQIQNAEQCYRYMGTLVKNIKVSDSPVWLKERMESMGQRSINNLVDATNFVMFDLGQPMHVFDADKVAGKIIIRNAQEGEKITTLSGEELELLATDLVIADEEKVLALAGVKGGNLAEVDENTKNIIIESANFNPTTTRSTARRVKILTDASKRYENGICSEFAAIATDNMLSLVYDLAKTDETQIGIISDDYQVQDEEFFVNVKLAHIQSLLGFEISNEQVSEIFEKFAYSYDFKDEAFKVTIPAERLDLRIPEDLIEEIGRLFGYHNIPVKSLDEIDFTPHVHGGFALIQELKNFFIQNGFSELMNYSFVNKGEVEMFNPIASDKKALRKNLKKQIAESLEKNARIADYIGEDQIKIFEIDRVHTGDQEKYLCTFAIDTLSKKSRKKYGNEDIQIEALIESLKQAFHLDQFEFEKEGSVVSFELDQFDTSGITYELDMRTYSDEVQFSGISVYPYMKRDISFWTQGVSADEMRKRLESCENNFLKKVYLFDEFEKDGKISLAYSLIFQSDERTLTDVDVDADMEKINTLVKSLGGELR